MGRFIFYLKGVAFHIRLSPSISSNTSNAPCSDSVYSHFQRDDTTSPSTVVRPEIMPSIPLLQAYSLSHSQKEDFNTYIQENVLADTSQQVSPITYTSNHAAHACYSNVSTTILEPRTFNLMPTITCTM